MAASNIPTSSLLWWTLITFTSGPLPDSGYLTFDRVFGWVTDLLQKVDHQRDLSKHPNPGDMDNGGGQIYDFIIVGGGTSGCTLANRLSANPNVTILLLEAGGNPNPFHSIPVLHAWNNHQPATDWMYVSEPLVTSCLACNDTRLSLPRGKLLGGSSNLNTMIYIRGNPNDFDNWANETGDPQWKYENVLPFFKRSENYKGNFSNPKYHGTTGSQGVVGQQDYNGPLLNAWLEAGMEKGYPIADPNGWQKSLFAGTEFNIKDGKRSQGYNAFLKPVLSRTNLHVVRYAHVTKINFHPLTKRATGVTYVRNGTHITVNASQEVILSAGAIGSPHLLMLSGIGDTKQLSSFDIPVISNLPGVGRNLMDHIFSPAGPFILNESVSFLPERDLDRQDLLQYQINGTGPIADPVNPGAGVAYVSSENPPNNDWPDIQLLYSAVGVSKGLASSWPTYLSFQEKPLQEYFKDHVGKDAVFVLVNLERPKSKGSVKLRSADPFDKPIIDLKYFDHPDDIKIMVKGFEIIVDLIENSKAFRKYNASLVSTKFPGCEDHPLKSKEYYECYIRHLTSTVWHQSCTARMGHDRDAFAVLDSKLRVRGVTGLRVVDVSSMPHVTNGNTNAPTVMIAEKAADMILRDVCRRASHKCMKSQQ